MSKNDEKSFEPSTKKLEKAKKLGMGPKSHEFSSMLFLLIFTILSFICTPFFFAHLKKIFAESFEGKLSLRIALFPFIIFFGFLFCLSFLITFFKGVVFVPLKLKWARREKKRILFKAFYLFLKLTVVFFVLVLFWKHFSSAFDNFDQQPSDIKVSALFVLGTKFAVFLSFALFGVSIFEFFYQKWRFRKDMKMTKEEVEEEKKEIEGAKEVKDHLKNKMKSTHEI